MKEKMEQDFIQKVYYTALKIIKESSVYYKDDIATFSTLAWRINVKQSSDGIIKMSIVNSHNNDVWELRRCNIDEWESMSNFIVPCYYISGGEIEFPRRSYDNLIFTYKKRLEKENDVQESNMITKFTTGFLEDK